MIFLKFEKADDCIGGLIRVLANRASIGTLFPFEKWLKWEPDIRNYNVKFQFRNEDTFLEVVNQLKNYKAQQGYKYLVITSIGNGYASQLDKELIRKAGFVSLPNESPDLFFLE